MKRPILLAISILAFSALALSSGCAKLGNRLAANGGLIGSYKGDYIVRNDSGGRIMDVWVLHDRIVQNDEHTTGWLFQDMNNNPVHISGDAKIIRVNAGIDVTKYHEYHAEFERCTYQELYVIQPRT